MEMKLIGLMMLLRICVNGLEMRSPKITENPADTIVIKGEPATLRCAADGVPEPQITWFRNGVPVSIAPDDPKSHRILLPGGSLFFLKASHGRRETDSGIYWCTARNSGGGSQSANASLTVAYLQSEFRIVPQAMRAVRGESALLECEAPKGHPDPRVIWRKDGQPLHFSSRLKMDVGGNLLIEVVNHSDAGRYQCVASNVAGARESPQAILSVHGRPEIFKVPQSASVLAGEDAYFECQAVGDPIPRITWFKGTNVVGNGRTLRIVAVAPADQGVYVCEADSIVGVSKANATLSVFVQPTVTVTEKHVKVISGETVALPCRAEGLPTPQISWIKEKSSTWETFRQTDDKDRKLLVDGDGSLFIKDIKTTDGGRYVCMAVNGGGADFSRTIVRVLRRRPTKIPPTIHVGPANQTLPLRSIGILHCEVENARISWTKDGAEIGPGERLTMSEQGTLRIEVLQSSDAGIYECIGKNEAGETHWPAKLAVESPTNPNIAFHRTSNDPLALPGSPSQARILTRSAHSITITWRSGARMGASPSIGYMVEYLATEEDPQNVRWTVAARRLQSDTFTLTSARVDSSYLFVVRAENSHGLSLPSPPSEWVDFENSELDLEDPDVKHIRENLSAPGIRFDAATALNTTAVQLQWEVTESEVKLSSVLITWHSEDNSTSWPMTTATVEPSVSSIMIGGLKPGTQYNFFLVPVADGLVGRPTKSRGARTHEEPPLPSVELYIRQQNSTTIRVSIRPPLPATTHRKLQLVVTSIPERSTTVNVVIPPETGVLLVSGLIVGENYVARLYATSTEENVAVSPPVTFTMTSAATLVAMMEEQSDGHSKADFNDAWFAVLIGSLLTGSIIVFGAAFLTRRKMMRKKERTGCVTGKPSTGNIYKSPDMKPGAMRGWEVNQKERLNFTLLPQAVEVDSVYAEVNHGPTFTSFQRNPGTYYSSSSYGADPMYGTLSRTKLYATPLAFSDVSNDMPCASTSGASIYEPEVYAPLEPHEETPMFYQSVPVPMLTAPHRQNPASNGTHRNGSAKKNVSSPRSFRRNNSGYHLTTTVERQPTYGRPVAEIEFMRSHH